MQISSAHQFLYGKLKSEQARYAALEQTYLHCTEALRDTIYAIEHRQVPDTATMDRYKKLTESEPGHAPPRSTLPHDKSHAGRRGGWMERSVPLVAAVLSDSWDWAKQLARDMAAVGQMKSRLQEYCYKNKVNAALPP